MSDYECPGAGRCHGCMSWCDACGDVDGVCSAAVCWQHRCRFCNEMLSEDEREMAFALGGRPAECFVCFVKHEAKHELDNGHDEMRALERATDTVDVYRRSGTVNLYRRTG